MNSTDSNFDLLKTLTKSKAFLNYEFLTWLWYLCEQEKGKIEFSDEQDEEIEFWIDDRIHLQAFGSNANENIVKGGTSSQSEEAQASLISGKFVKELKLGFRFSNLGECTLNLNAKDLNPKGVRLPRFSKSDVEKDLGTRLFILEKIIKLLDQLFEKFIDERTTESWSSEGVEKLRLWVKQRQPHSDKNNPQLMH